MKDQMSLHAIKRISKIIEQEGAENMAFKTMITPDKRMVVYSIPNTVIPNAGDDDEPQDSDIFVMDIKELHALLDYMDFLNRKAMPTLTDTDYREYSDLEHNMKSLKYHMEQAHIAYVHRLDASTDDETIIT